MHSRIKLLAIARARNNGLELRVAPTLVPFEHPLASVTANFNGVFIKGSAAGSTLLIGPGAGALPTASAVLADVVDICTGRYQATSSMFQFFKTQPEAVLLPEAEEVTSSYARFSVPDKPGILAGIASVLSQHGLSLMSLHQGEPNKASQAVIEAITHPFRGGSFLAAIDEIDRKGLTVSPTVALRRL